MTHRIADTRRPAPRGFTLLEMTIALVIGLFVSILLMELGFFVKNNPEALSMVDTQYETLREMERITGEYRNRLEQGTLNLDSMLSNWSASNGVTVSEETVSITSTDGSVTFSGVRKVHVTKDGQTFTAYFTE